MSKLDDTIHTLVDDLTPIGHPARPGRTAFAWCLAAMLATAACLGGAALANCARLVAQAAGWSVDRLSRELDRTGDA